MYHWKTNSLDGFTAFITTAKLPIPTQKGLEEMYERHKGEEPIGFCSLLQSLQGTAQRALLEPDRPDL